MGENGDIGDLARSAHKAELSPLTLDAEEEILGYKSSELHEVLRNSAELTELCQDMDLNCKALKAQKEGQDRELEEARRRHATASAAVECVQDKINSAKTVAV